MTTDHQPPSPHEPAVVRHGRALFVVLHLFAITFLALPSVGGGMSRSAWRTPTVQSEFEVWTERVNRLGFDWKVGEVEDVLWDFAVSYEKGRAKIIGPLRPYFTYAGTWQSWRMFVAPHRYPGRLEIEIKQGNGWEPVYVARSSEHDWMRSWMDHDRFRAATFRYGWSHYKPYRIEFTDWVARRAAVDFPEADRVRVSFVRYRTRSPQEVRDEVVADEKRELKNVRKLGPLR